MIDFNNIADEIIFKVGGMRAPERAASISQLAQDLLDMAYNNINISLTELLDLIETYDEKDVLTLRFRESNVGGVNMYCEIYFYDPQFSPNESISEICLFSNNTFATRLNKYCKL